MLNKCLPGRHHSPVPPGWSNCASEPSSERRRAGHTERKNSVSRAARTVEVFYRMRPLTWTTMTMWCAVYSGGLQGSPSSSDMVPASSVRFTHMRDGGEPSLMACFSCSCRNTKQPVSCFNKCHINTDVCVSKVHCFQCPKPSWTEMHKNNVYFKPCVRKCVCTLCVFGITETQTRRYVIC